MKKQSNISVFMRRNREIVIAWCVLIVVLLLYSFFMKDFWSKYGPQSICNQVVTLSIVAFGQLVVVMTGGIDLSVGPMVALCNCIFATILAPVIEFVGGSILPGVILAGLVAMACGALVGVLNATIVVFGRIQPIVVTLSTSMICSGAALLVRPEPGGDVTRTFCKFMTGRAFDIIPVSFIIILIMVFCVWKPFRRTGIGQGLLAIGGNEYSAYTSGIKINKTKFMAYVICGIMAGLAAIVLTASTASGDATGSANYTINSIAAVVLGGASLMGGRGSYVGSVAGAMILSLILGLLIFWGVSSWYQNAAQGGILLVALSIGALRTFLAKKAACHELKA
ncbi:MAG: ABC transporter permease [Oscillospiraceae bacterium]